MIHRKLLFKFNDPDDMLRRTKIDEEGNAHIQIEEGELILRPFHWTVDETEE